MNNKFAATELIEKLYQIDKSNLIELKNKINFSEESTKGFGDNTITESLAQNIVKNLPFDTYKDLIELSWFSEIKYKKQNNPIHTALFYKKFEFVEYILSQLDIKLIDNNKNNTKFNNDDRIFSQLVLQKIIDFPIKESLTEIGYTQKDVTNNFFGIWNHAVNLMYDYEQYIYINSDKRDGSDISPIRKLDKIQDIRINEKLLLRESCCNKSMFSFFAQVMNELTEKEKEEIKSFPTKSLLMTALFNNNKKVADFLIKESFYNNKSILEIIDETSQRVSKTGLSEKDNKEYKKYFEVARALLSEKELEKVPASSLLGITTLYQNNKEELNKLISDFPQILTDNLFYNENLNLKKIISLQKFKDHFESKFGVNFLKLKDTVEYYNINKIIKNLSNYIEGVEDKEFVGLVMQSSTGLLNKFKMDIFEVYKSTTLPNEYNQTLEKELLDFLLPTKEMANEKSKVKL